MICDAIVCYFAAAAPTTLEGALVDGSDASNPSQFSTEVYDIGGYHSTVTNTSRLTIPAGGLYRFTGELQQGTAMQSVAITPSTNSDGAAYARFTGVGQRGGPLMTAPIALTTSDYATMTFAGGTGSPVAGGWFAVEKLDSALRYAHLKRSTDLVISSGTATVAIGFDTEIADTSGWHSGSSSQLVVPSGVSRVRLVANTGPASANAGMVYEFFTLGGSTFRGSGKFGTPIINVGAAGGVNPVSAVINVSASDVLELQFETVATSASITFDHTAGLWFSVEEIPSSYQCCLAYRSTNQSLTLNTPTAVNWDAEVYDDASIHDVSTNPNRFTAPAGTTYARMSYSINPVSGVDVLHCVGRMNGSYASGLPSSGHWSQFNTAAANGISAWVPCSPGDYFDLTVEPSATFNLGNNNHNWLCMEFR